MPLLKEAVESVLSQSRRDIELIIADDGSTDQTADYAEELSRRTEIRLRYLPLTHSGFPGLVRNRGAAAAEAGLLAFLDSDDIWKADKLKKQLPLHASALTPPSCRISHTRELWLRGDTVVSQKKQRHRRSGIVFTDALKKCMIGPSTVIMERSLFEEFGGFREDLEIAEDYEFWLRICCCHPVAYLDEMLTVKRAWELSSAEGIAAGQLSEKYGHIEYFRIQALKDLVDRGFFTDAGRKQEAEAAGVEDPAGAAQRELARKCRIFARGAEKRGRSEEARRYFHLSERYASRGSIL
jgi:glycosyltransferase involved in cell wall biosynthesis